MVFVFFTLILIQSEKGRVRGWVGWSVSYTLIIIQSEQGRVRRMSKVECIPYLDTHTEWEGEGEEDEQAGEEGEEEGAYARVLGVSWKICSKLAWTRQCFCALLCVPYRNWTCGFKNASKTCTWYLSPHSIFRMNIPFNFHWNIWQLLLCSCSWDYTLFNVNKENIYISLSVIFSYFPKTSRGKQGN